MIQVNENDCIQSWILTLSKTIDREFPTSASARAERVSEHATKMKAWLSQISYFVMAAWREQIVMNAIEIVIVLCICHMPFPTYWTFQFNPAGKILCNIHMQIY